MENLPPEVLSHVFAFAIPRHGYRDRYVSETTNGPQAELSLVCRYWEQVVIKTPQLWSYIHLSLNTREQTLQRRIELSSREPLDVRVDANVDTSKTFPDLYNILLATIDRWRSFVLQDTDTFFFDRSLKRWIPKQLPNVVEAGYYRWIDGDDVGLELFDHDSGDFQEYPFKPWTAAPKLRRFAAEKPGQFHFRDCPLVTECAISDMKQGWGGSSDVHSWHDKWEEYFTQLAELCPQLEILELSDWWDSDCVDPMGWTRTETKWPRFPHLRTLKANAVGSATTIPIISKFNAPNLKNLHLGNIHHCLPLPLPFVTLGIDLSSCQVHFDWSPLHAIKLFLEGVSQVQELRVTIQLAQALGMVVMESFNFVDERGYDSMGEAGRIMEDWTWIKENTRSVQWILPQEISGLLSEGELTAESTAALVLKWRMGLLRRQVV